MTLIAVYNSEGCVGRCDARCYGATTPECDCICGGMNHGAGKNKAMANTEEHAKRMIEEYAGRKGLEDFEAALFQRSLFGEPVGASL
jgi:hypothetical protein